jgi:hypothetical protein
LRIFPCADSGAFFFLKIKKEKKGLVTGTNGDEGYLLSVDVEPTSSVEQRNESKVTEAFANFDRHSIASK